LVFVLINQYCTFNGIAIYNTNTVPMWVFHARIGNEQ
jgi:hypothetical protein